MTVEREREKKKEILVCNGEWEKYKGKLEEEIQEFGEQMKYEKLEKAIQQASKHSEI